MTEFKTLVVPFSNGGHVKLLFKKFSPWTEWVCEMSDEFIELVEEELEQELHEKH